MKELLAEMEAQARELKIADCRTSMEEAQHERQPKSKRMASRSSQSSIVNHQSEIPS